MTWHIIMPDQFIIELLGLKCIHIIGCLLTNLGVNMTQFCVNMTQFGVLITYSDLVSKMVLHLIISICYLLFVNYYLFQDCHCFILTLQIRQC